ncbi:MAG: hypothetical protein J6R82_05095 [Clostridia bacterium]|nr:hypothetical protein [Clostridia bacterium]
MKIPVCRFMSVILLLIVSTLLIGIMMGCDSVETVTTTTTDAVTPQPVPETQECRHEYVDGVCIHCEGDYSDKITGPDVALTVSYGSIQEFAEFYSAFQKQNTASLVLFELKDQENAITYYNFYGGIVNRETFPKDYDYAYEEFEFSYEMYYNCRDILTGQYDYAIVAENYVLDQEAVIDLNNVTVERVYTEMEQGYADADMSNKKGEIRYYEIRSGEYRLLKFAICAVVSTEDSYYESICQQVVDGLVKFG